MKIAILTLPLHVNYGGILQNYALVHILQDMGHDVFNIDLPSNLYYKLPLWRLPLSYSNRFIKKFIWRKQTVLFKEQKMRKENPIIGKYIDDFIKQYIPQTHKYTTIKALSELENSDFDAFIVGSDQVWRVIYAFQSIETFFFDFLGNSKAKRLAYAASFGTDKQEFSAKQIQTCGNLYKKFNAVSVREDSGINMIKQLYKWTGAAPAHVLDPTMLMDMNDYMKLVEKSKAPKSKGDLFYYVLDMTDDKQKTLDKIRDHYNLTPFTVFPKSRRITDCIEDRTVPPIENWLRAFFDAKYVLTDSFHGCIFSIIFNKPFIAYGNADRGIARFQSLLNMFGLSDRYIKNSSELDNITINIDWDKINAIRQKAKIESIRFLNDNLK